MVVDGHGHACRYWLCWGPVAGSLMVAEHLRRRTSALAKTVQAAAARGMGAGMGGGGHANNPVFTFQGDWSRNKYKGAVFVFGLFGMG